MSVSLPFQLYHHHYLLLHYFLPLFNFYFLIHYIFASSSSSSSAMSLQIATNSALNIAFILPPPASSKIPSPWLAPRNHRGRFCLALKTDEPLEIITPIDGADHKLAEVARPSDHTLLFSFSPLSLLLLGALPGGTYVLLFYLIKI